MARIHVIGLGPGNENLITKEAERLMRSGFPLYLRTEIHPTVDWMRQEKIPFQAMDVFYENDPDFDSVYADMVNYIIKQAKREQEIVYAVPGSPLVAEKTVVLLRNKAAGEDVELHIVPGMSFMEVLYVRMALDPVEGITIADGEALDTIPATLMHPLVITQVYNRQIVSDVKLTLMDRYGDDSPVVLIRHLSLPDESVETMPLYELDRHFCDHLTLVLFYPKEALKREVKPFSLTPLIEVMRTLREPGGCPWDRLQTHSTLRTYLVQEVSEVLDAIDHEDADNLMEELGDVLLQIVFHARIAEENGLFTMQDVINGITGKMEDRHPFVFGEVRKTEAAEMIGSWEMRKMKEKGRSHLLEGLPEYLPSLLFTCIIQKKVSSVGIETTDTAEEIRHHFLSFWEKAIREAKDQKSGNGAEKSFGEALFETVRFFQYFGVDAELALHRFNSQFLEEFNNWESHLISEGTDIRKLPPKQVKELWRQWRKR